MEKGDVIEDLRLEPPVAAFVGCSTFTVGYRG